MHTDDTAICTQSRNITNLESNEKHKICLGWSNFNTISINKNKTNYMIFTTLEASYINLKFLDHIYSNLAKLVGLFYRLNGFLDIIVA